MKITADRKSFIKALGLAKPCAGIESPMTGGYAPVMVSANYEGIVIRSTNNKTSMICKVNHVHVEEPGCVLLPVRSFSEMVGKAGSDTFKLNVKGNIATLTAGRSQFRFNAYPHEDFPSFSSSSGAGFYFSARADALASAVKQGAICASLLRDPIPLYFSTVKFGLTSGGLSVVSTDTVWLAVSRLNPARAGEPASVLLPLRGVRHLLKAICSLRADSEVTVMRDDEQVYFIAQGVECRLGIIKTHFPEYERVLPTDFAASADMDKNEIISAMERMDLVARNYNRTVTMVFEQEVCILRAHSPVFGDASEGVSCSFDGDTAKAWVKSRLFIDAVRSCDDPVINVSIDKPHGNVVITPKNSPGFVCVIAPAVVDSDESARHEQNEYEATSV